MSNLSPRKINYRKEKLKCLLQTQDYSDCTFICGDERIPAHKLLLACNSPVFELMFFGQMAATEIEVTDINPEDLRKMLEYIYTDYVDIKTLQSAWNLIYISQKYFLSDLLELCIDFVKKNLTVSNLLISYEYGQLYNHQELVKLCWQDILRYSKGIMFNTDYHMQKSTLVNILSQIDINASTLDLALIAIKWAIEECISNEKDFTPENIFNILSQNELLNYLDLNCFDSYEFEHLSTEHPYNSINYLCNIAIKLKNNYGRQLRNKILLETKANILHFKFRDVYKIAKNVMFTDSLEVKSDIISNRTVYLYGVAVTTLHRPQKAETNNYESSLSIKFMHNNRVFYNGIIGKQNLEYDHLQLINLPVPVKLEKGITYSIIIVYSSGSFCKRGEVVLHYASQRVVNRKNYAAIQFGDEPDGSVLQGVSYYPA